MPAAILTGQLTNGDDHIEDDDLARLDGVVGVFERRDVSA